MSYRDQSVYVSSQCRFYLALRAKQLVEGTTAKRTEDETADCDLINLYETEHPEWVLAWDKHQNARQRLKKELAAIEAEVLNLSPELAVNGAE